ncbi:MAG TPA: polysaccharide export protein EpsE [Steroidobacteraceae bacterium]|jgi:polysaccharide export outer membrane protein|nr:polysaccharide export protein EpsE [Steroidobacteraceae bacterium]
MRINSMRACVMAFVISLLAMAQASAKPEDYRLGAGDLLRIAVFDHDELSVDARISQSGNITFPLVGQVQVAGLSTREAELLLARRLIEGGFVKQPQISVLVSEYQSQKVSVMGQVAKPGQYPLDASKKVLDALALAGGVLNDTAADDVTLVRADGSRIVIDLQKLFDGDPAVNLVVQDGDTVFVAHAPQFYIYGQVQRPGQYKLVRNTSISQAISIGGGLTPRGTQRGAVVKRVDAKGKEHKISVKDEDVLQPNDVLMIKASLF